jgi:hypothetical protein
MDRFRILSRFGPTISKDPIVAGHWIRQTLEYPVVSPTVLREVTDVESKAREIMGTTPLGPGHAIKAVGAHVSKGLSDMSRNPFGS